MEGTRDTGTYDLMLSCVDNFVDYFRRQGVESERLRFGFEPGVLSRFSGSERPIAVSFGNVFSGHASRLRWLDHVCQRLSVQMWAPSLCGLPDTSPIIRRHRGAAWGAEMYRVLHQSRITLKTPYRCG